MPTAPDPRRLFAADVNGSWKQENMRMDTWYTVEFAIHSARVRGRNRVRIGRYRNELWPVGTVAGLTVGFRSRTSRGFHPPDESRIQARLLLSGATEPLLKIVLIIDGIVDQRSRMPCSLREVRCLASAFQGDFACAIRAAPPPQPGSHDQSQAARISLSPSPKTSCPAAASGVQPWIFRGLDHCCWRQPRLRISLLDNQPSFPRHSLNPSLLY